MNAPVEVIETIKQFELVVNKKLMIKALKLKNKTFKINITSFASFNLLVQRFWQGKIKNVISAKVCTMISNKYIHFLTIFLFNFPAQL